MCQECGKLFEEIIIYELIAAIKHCIVERHCNFPDTVFDGSTK